VIRTHAGIRIAQPPVAVRANVGGKAVLAVFSILTVLAILTIFAVLAIEAIRAVLAVRAVPAVRAIAAIGAVFAVDPVAPVLAVHAVPTVAPVLTVRPVPAVCAVLAVRPAHVPRMDDGVVGQTDLEIAGLVDHGALHARAVLAAHASGVEYRTVAHGKEEIAVLVDLGIDDGGGGGRGGAAGEQGQRQRQGQECCEQLVHVRHLSLVCFRPARGGRGPQTSLKRCFSPFFFPHRFKNEDSVFEMFCQQIRNK